MAKIRQSNLDNSIITGLSEITELGNDNDVILIYDDSAGVLKKIKRSNIKSSPATLSSISPTTVQEEDGAGNYTFTVTGTNFVAGTTANLLNTSGGTVNFDTVTIDSSTQLTCVIAKSSMPASGEPYDISVSNSDGSATLTDQVNINSFPAWVTASGSLGNFSEQTTISTITLSATDPEGGSVSYEIQSGSLPPGLSLNSSNGEITGTLSTDRTGTTTTNFVIRAFDSSSNTASRSFSITETPSGIESFTSSGTFSVPTGITTVDALVVAGGGGGGNASGGGGGAGGLIYRPGLPVSPGSTIPVTVGCGGSNGGPGASGQDSIFSTLTAKGGGGGGGPRNHAATSGGSGGGAGAGAGPGSVAPGTQPTQPGDSGTYGFGNNGSGSGAAPNWGAGAGGGAGAAGGGAGPYQGGQGGAGRAYTIADGTTPVYYAGGGGGATDHGSGTVGQGGQGGGAAGGGGGTGQANKGGGGGGGGGQDGNGPAGGPGGKGIVIISY
jgi:hypothetical protein